MRARSSYPLVWVLRRSTLFQITKSIHLPSQKPLFPALGNQFLRSAIGCQVSLSKRLLPDRFGIGCQTKTGGKISQITPLSMQVLCSDQSKQPLHQSGDTAVFSVVTQRSSPLSGEERCVTTLKTAVQQTTSAQESLQKGWSRMPSPPLY